MLGMTLGPVTGRLAGEILSGGKPEIDMTLLSPDRYA
jgi:D-amino-acid dehydrogenase